MPLLPGPHPIIPYSAGWPAWPKPAAIQAANTFSHAAQYRYMYEYE